MTAPTDATLEQVPPEPLLRLFLRYLRFGALAWGGPVAQIAMIRKELVGDKGWVSNERFNRTLAVYQVLPGPEAQELCVHYGMASRGWVGAILAGLGFMLPGFLLMLALSWIYVEVGLGSAVAVGVLAAMRPAVLGLVVRAVHRIAKHALHDVPLVVLAVASAAATLFGAPFYVALPVAGITYALWVQKKRVVAAILVAGMVGIFAGLFAHTWVTGPEAAAATDGSLGEDPDVSALFWSGLKAGSLTFGGAYTVIPFLEDDATGAGGWMTREQFLEGIALSGILPAPLIIFATFVGYVGGGFAGALAMTVGIFLPAFAFTLVGFPFFDRLVANPRLHAFLDGVTAGVIGLITTTALMLVPAAIRQPADLGIFAIVLVLQYVWKSKAAVPVAMLGAGVAGLVLTLV